MKFLFDVQYFADEENSVQDKTGEDPSSDAGKKEEKNKPSFDELIRGDYRKEYGEKVEEIIKNRIKDHHELKKNYGDITSMLDGLKEELGLEGKEATQILSQIKDKLSKGATNAEAEGTQAVEQRKKAMEKLIRGCEAAKEFYPQFEMKKELEDPEFRRMLKLTDNDPKMAFEILHHDEIMASVIKDTVRMTEERISGSIASRANRPAEGAQSAVNAVYINQDPKALSKADRADIKRRVRRGERIVW